MASDVDLLLLLYAVWDGSVSDRFWKKALHGLPEADLKRMDELIRRTDNPSRAGSALIAHADFKPVNTVHSLEQQTSMSADSGIPEAGSTSAKKSRRDMAPVAEEFQKNVLDDLK